MYVYIYGTHILFRISFLCRLLRRKKNFSNKEFFKILRVIVDLCLASYNFALFELFEESTYTSNENLHSGWQAKKKQIKKANDVADLLRVRLSIFCCYLCKKISKFLDLNACA